MVSVTRAVDFAARRAASATYFPTPMPRLASADWHCTVCAASTRSVAVLGAGHGGLALAGYLSRAGHRVVLWNRSAGRIDAVAAQGGVRLARHGAPAAFVPIARTTTDIADVLRSVRAVFVGVPASAHAEVARQAAPHLCDGQTVLLLPGRTGGALEFRRVLREEGCHAAILLGEACSFPFAARNTAPAEAVILAEKHELAAAALPACDTPQLLAACRPFLPMLSPARSVLNTGLANVGSILHPAIMLMNAGRILRGEVFDFYREGVTGQVARVLAAADAERLRIARAYGEAVPSLSEWIRSAYGHRAATILQAVTGNPAYTGIRAPTTLQHRYLFEDLPTGVIPLIELGAAAGVATPALASLETLAEFHLGRSFAGGEFRGRTLASLGLADLGVEDIRAVVGTDWRPALPPRVRWETPRGVLSGHMERIGTCRENSLSGRPSAIACTSPAW